MQFRCMEGGERVDRFDGLRLYVPFEEPQHYFVGGEIGEDEAMLLDRLQLLLEIEHCRGRSRRTSNTRGGPAAGPRADRSRQRDVDRVLAYVERAASLHRAARDRMHVAAHDERHAAFHG